MAGECYKRFGQSVSLLLVKGTGPELRIGKMNSLSAEYEWPTVMLSLRRVGISLL
jgi:hypothetical protein